MSKFNKFVNVFFKVLFFILIAGLLATGIAYFIKPDEVKEVVIGFWNEIQKPLPVVGCSILFIFLCVLKFISTTSIGKKGLNELKLSNQNTVTKVKDMQSQLNALLVSFQTEIFLIKDLVVDALRKSPNVNIKACADNIETQFNIGVKELQNKIGEFKTQLLQINNQVPSYNFQALKEDLELFKTNLIHDILNEIDKNKQDAVNYIETKVKEIAANGKENQENSIVGTTKE